MQKLTSVAIFIMAGSLFVFQGQAQNTFPSSGNAGIGTTSPVSPLDIRAGGAGGPFPPQGISVNVNDSAHGFWFGNVLTSNQTSSNTSTFQSLSVTALTSQPAGSNVNVAMPALFSAQQNAAGTVTEMRAVEGQFIMAATAGNVGSFKLFYANSGIINGGTPSGTVGTGYGFFMMPFPSNVSNKYGVYINDSSASNYFGGTMTIGTRMLPPGYSLAVDGSAIFTKAVVQTFSNWPDYVFEKGYRLQPLDSLAGYIRANRHLPEIPSAGEVKDKGLDVGSNEATLLKKVEELTLYLIRQNDELKAQRKLLKSQQATIKSMQRKPTR